MPLGLSPPLRSSPWQIDSLNPKPLIVVASYSQAQSHRSRPTMSHRSSPEDTHSSHGATQLRNSSNSEALDASSSSSSLSASVPNPNCPALHSPMYDEASRSFATPTQRYRDPQPKSKKAKVAICLSEPQNTAEKRRARVYVACSEW